MTPELEKNVQAKLAELLANGTSLSEAQNLINTELGLKLTYMEIRILASTLPVDWKKLDPHPAAPQKPETDAPPAEEAVPAAGKTVVEISKLVRPGTAISGTVQFASGPKADWYVDQTGRLGLENLSGGEPTPEDIQEFQRELQAAISGGRR